MFPNRCWKACLGALVYLCVLAGPAQGSAQQFTQYYTVDCSNPSAQYPTINSALAVATNGAWIWVKPGTICTENVTLGHFTNIAISTDWQQTYNLAGNLTIDGSQSVWIQGMIVTNASGDGIDVNNSSDVEFDFASSVNNSGAGLSIANGSNVTIGDYGTFDSNGAKGINVAGNSFLVISAWGGVVDISNNLGAGINLDRAVAYTYNNTTINNNRAAPGGSFPNGFGITEFGGAKAGIFGFGEPTSIASNQGGGVAIEESSEISLGGTANGVPYSVNVQDNGAFGVFAEYGSQVTFFEGVQVTGHSTAGVSLYGNSQAAIYGTNNQITNNGTATDPDRAGILVDNGSQAYVSTASIQNNGGPGILGRLHATLDVEGSTFSSNTGGAIVCDQSTALETDLPHSVLGSASSCTVSAPASHHLLRAGNTSLSLPDWQSIKARSMKIYQMSTEHQRAAAPTK